MKASPVFVLPIITRIVKIALVSVIAGCAPPYARGDDGRVREQLLVIVPIGSSPTYLEKAGSSRGWRVDIKKARKWPAGEEMYFDNCRSFGGIVVPAIVAQYYAPFHTTVETLWLLDSHKRLRDVCARKTVSTL